MHKIAGFYPEEGKGANLPFLFLPESATLLSDVITKNYFAIGGAYKLKFF